MSWFWTVVFLGFAVSDFSEAKHHDKLQSAVVVGTVYCDTCFQQNFHRASHFISGASVAVECNDTGSKPSFRREVKTDHRGQFQVRLPFSVSKDLNIIKGCSVRLISSNHPYCTIAATATSSRFHLRSKTHGTHVFSAGFFTFKPLNQPQICDQKPTINDAAEKSSSPVSNLNDPIIPPPLSDPPAAGGRFLPPVPSGPPVEGGHFLPPLPLLPNLPPLPQLPRLPPLPGIPFLPPLPEKKTPVKRSQPISDNAEKKTPVKRSKPISDNAEKKTPVKRSKPISDNAVHHQQLPHPPSPKEGSVVKGTHHFDDTVDQPRTFPFFPPNRLLPPPSLFPANPFQPPSVFPPVFPTSPPSVFPPLFQTPPSPPLFNLPPFPAFAASPPPAALSIPLPPFPFQPVPGFPRAPPARDSSPKTSSP